LCDAWGFVAVRDPSNSDLRFRRNRVRHQLVPVLESVAERDVVPILARQAALLADDAAYLDAAAAEIDPTDVRALAVAPRALARRALRRWLRHGVERHPPTAAEVERVLSVVDGTAAACEVNGGRRVRRSRGRLRLELPDSVGTAMETEIREPETGQPETRQRPHR
jgi:tRNA(Ile)-lysidine synthase